MLPSKKSARQSTAAIQELVGRLFASKHHRIAVMDLLGSSMGAAHKFAPDRWSVVAFENALRLVVGYIEVITLSPESIHIIVHCKSKQDGIERWGEISGKTPCYRSVPSSMSFDFAPDALGKVYPIIASGHRAIIKAATKHPVNPASKNAYSPSVIEYLSDLLSRQLLHPRYYTESSSKDSMIYPDEIPEAKYYEGSAKRILVNAYERDPSARKACLNAHGFRCHVCNFSFEEVYGKVGAEFIHVHHLRSLATRGKRHTVNPEKDLRPVCPNCHAMLHRPQPMLTIEELKTQIQHQQLSPKRAVGSSLTDGQSAVS